MLTTVDRIQVVVRDRAAAVETWEKLLGAQQIGDDESPVLKARRTTVQAGRSLVELLEPSGDGPVGAWASEWHEGLYGVVFATADLDAMARHFNSAGIEAQEDGGALVVDPAATDGMPTSIVQQETREPVGRISHIYEVTNPVNDWQETAGRYTRLFGLDPTTYVPITSEAFGYTGTLTLFQRGQLDRVEITQTSGDGAMDRFFHKRGPSLYMCYAETDDVPALAAHLREAGARFAAGTGGAEHGLFIHPSALTGVLMGVSETDFAWSWSGGRPE